MCPDSFEELDDFSRAERLEADNKMMLDAIEGWRSVELADKKRIADLEAKLREFEKEKEQWRPQWNNQAEALSKIQELEAKLAKGEGEAAAMRLAMLAAARTFGHEHWDSTMRYGAGCPICILQKKASSVVDRSLSSTAGTALLRELEAGRKVVEAVRSETLSRDHCNKLLADYDSATKANTGEK